MCTFRESKKSAGTQAVLCRLFPRGPRLFPGCAQPSRTPREAAYKAPRGGLAGRTRCRAMMRGSCICPWLGKPCLVSTCEPTAM